MLYIEGVVKDRQGTWKVQVRTPHKWVYRNLTLCYPEVEWHLTIGGPQ